MFIGGFELGPEFTNLYTSFFDKIDSVINSNVSWINDAFSYIISMFNYLSQIIVWLSSYTGLTANTVLIILGLIGGGIGMIVGFFVIQTVVKWWSVLVP